MAGETVGVLAGVVGALLLAARNERQQDAIARRDRIKYIAKGRLPPIYLLDTAAEIALLNLSTAVRATARRDGRRIAFPSCVVSGSIRF